MNFDLKRHPPGPLAKRHQFLLQHRDRRPIRGRHQGQDIGVQVLEVGEFLRMLGSSFLLRMIESQMCPRLNETRGN